MILIGWYKNLLLLITASVSNSELGAWELEIELETVLSLEALIVLVDKLSLSTGEPSKRDRGQPWSVWLSLILQEELWEIYWCLYLVWLWLQENKA